MSRELQGERRRPILPTKFVATATSLERPKNNFTKITKNIFKDNSKHKPSSPALRAEQVG